MDKEVVVTDLPFNRKIVKITHHHQVTYKIQQGKGYIGKTKDGGYSSLKSAIEAASR